MTSPLEEELWDRNARAATCGHKEVSAAWEGAGAHTQLQVAMGWIFHVRTEWQRAPVRGSQVGVAEQNTPAPSRTHSGGSGGPSSSHLGWGVQQPETVSETREGRGGSTQHG